MLYIALCAHLIVIGAFLIAIFRQEQRDERRNPLPVASERVTEPPSDLPAAVCELVDRLRNAGHELGPAVNEEGAVSAVARAGQRRLTKLPGF